MKWRSFLWGMGCGFMLAFSLCLLWSTTQTADENPPSLDEEWWDQ